MIPSDGMPPQTALHRSPFFIRTFLCLFTIRLLPLFLRFLLIEGGRPIMLYFLKHSISSNY